MKIGVRTIQDEYTTTWKWEVELRQEQQSRIYSGRLQEVIG